MDILAGSNHREDASLPSCRPLDTLLARLPHWHLSPPVRFTMADLRLAEVLAALSQVTDLGMGQLPETAIRTCLLATGLARRMSLAEHEVAGVYYTALLQHVGCTAYAHETAALFWGDDIAVRSGGAKVDFAHPREALAYILLELGKGSGTRGRARSVLTAIRTGSTFDELLHRSNCEVAVRTASRLGLDTDVPHGLDHIFERWDGKGYPHGVSQDEIALPARFAQVADRAVLFDRLGGPNTAVATVRGRAGSALDPAIADTFATHGRSLLAELNAIDAVVAVIDAEPAPHHRVPDARLDEVARAFAETVDLKSPWTHGHSTGVAQLAANTASTLGLPNADVSTIRQAALLHDLGKAGLPNGILDKPGSLTSTEWEQVWLHPYHSERILSRSPVLAPLAPIAGMHHERLDGSGYYRHIPATMIPVSARLLAVANRYQAMTQERSWRPALSPHAAAEQVIAEAAAGLLDPEVVDGVLAVVGHPVPPMRREWPAGLTDREVEVLRLAAHGMSNKEIGAALSISPKTADHHIQHIYDKIGVSTRAGAALFAMEHELLREPGIDK